MLPYIDEIEEHNFDHSVRLLKKAGELGLLGADVPEEYGGLGLDKISSALITEKFSRAGSFSLSYGAHVGIGTLPIVFFGTEEQKKKYLPSEGRPESIINCKLVQDVFEMDCEVTKDPLFGTPHCIPYGKGRCIVQQVVQSHA